jgi:ketosteroid isomerase-like protein
MWNRGEVEAAIPAFIDPNVEWFTAGAFPDIEPVYRGHEGVRSFFRQFMEPWEAIEIHIEELVEPRPGHIAAWVRFHARGREGIEVDLEVGQYYELRNGLVYRFHAFRGWEETLAAAAGETTPDG